MILREELNDIVAKLDYKRKNATKPFWSDDAGRMSLQKCDGKYVFVVTKVQNGKRIRHKLKPDDPDIVYYLRNEFLEKEHRVIEHNIAVVKDALDNITSYNHELPVLEMKKKYPNLDEDFILDAIKDFEEDEWAKADYERQDTYLENRTKITSRGLKVRSKSEVVIAEKLYEFNQVFRSEPTIRIQNVDLHPDFLIRRKDGRLVIWEHEGLTNNQDYLNVQLRKQQLYASAGFVPWKNLIITYDTSDGDIDVRIIESEIKNKLLL